MVVQSKAAVSKHYTQLADDASGIMHPGLDTESFVDAVHDERTIFLQNTKIPLVVPVEYYPWIRTKYFRDQGIRSDLYVYVGWPGLCESFAVDPVESHVQMLEQLAAAKGVLVFEQSQQRDIRSLLMQSFKKTDKSWQFKDLLTNGTLPNGTSTTYRTDHHIYEAEYRGTPGVSSTRMSDIYDVFSTDGTTTLVAQLSTHEIPKVYADYVAAFRETRRHGAIDAIIPKNDFTDWMQNPQFLKYIQRDKDGIINMCVLTSVRNIDYMQPSYFEKKAPGKFVSDEILCCPIVYSRHDAPKGSGVKTTTGIARSFKVAQNYPQLIVECNDVSNKYMMRIFSRGATAAGLELTVADGSPLVQSVELALAG